MPFINVSPFHEFLSGMNFILQINVGVVKLLGEGGTGKTTLLQELVRSATQGQQDIVAFYSAPPSFQEIKDTIRQQLNLDPAVNFHDAVLNHVLAKPVEQRRLTVVFDNAELLDDATLLAVGHLRSIQHAGQNLIGIVLCGRPEFNRIVRQAEHHLLAKDILLSYDLSPLSSQQLPDFCRGCLAARGLDGFVLVADDYKQIMEKSGGLPGKVAELVETYWPEDPEISEPSAKTATAVVPAREPEAQQQNVFDPQSTVILENTTTVAEPIFFTPTTRTGIIPDVTPVISPDMSFEISSDAPLDGVPMAAPGGQFEPDVVTDITQLGSQAASFDGAAEFAAEVVSGFTVEPAAAFTTDTSPGFEPAVASNVSADVVREAPQQNSSVIAPDFIEVSSGYVIDLGYRRVEQHTADVASDLAAEIAAVDVFRTAEVAPESRLDFASGFAPEASYDAVAAALDAGAEVPADVTAEVSGATCDAAQEPQAVVATDFTTAGHTASAIAFPHQASAEFSPEPVTDGLASTADETPQQPAAIASGSGLPSEVATDAVREASDFVTSSDAFPDATYDVSPAPLKEVSFDFSSDTPVEIALGLASEPAATAPSEAPQEIAELITPVAASALIPAAPVAPSRLRIIVGALIAASVVVVIAQIVTSGSDTNTTATPAVAVAEPAPATPPQTAGQNPVATVSVQQFGDPAAVTPPIATSPASASQPALTTVTPAAAQTPIAAPASPTSPEAIATVAEGVVTAWVNAWQSQDVDAYLAFYHADFVPPNGASRDGWENNRDRIISSQSSISIEIADFKVLDTIGDQIRMQFLLTYRGDNYADRTLKELTLQPDASGELRIVQEQNVRTEAFDPVIEAASSWMPDSAANAADEIEADVRAMQLQPRIAVLGAVPTEPRPNVAARRPEAAVSSTPLAADAEIIPLIFNLTSLSDADVQQVNGVLQAWAEAWQSKDTEQYLSHYHPDYKALEAASVADWRAERIAKIGAAQKITINLNELEILQNNDDNLLLELLMEYHADEYADRTLKRMLLSKSAQGVWLITMESNLEVEQL